MIGLAIVLFAFLPLGCMTEEISSPIHIAPADNTCGPTLNSGGLDGGWVAGDIMPSTPWTIEPEPWFPSRLCFWPSALTVPWQGNQGGTIPCTKRV